MSGSHSAEDRGECDEKMVGKLISVKNGPERNVKIAISSTEVSSEISSPTGNWASRDIDYYEITGLENEETGLATLTFVLTDHRRVLFYSTHSKLDMVLLLDQLDGMIGARRREVRP